MEDFIKVVEEAYLRGYFSISQEYRNGCYGLHCDTPYNSFYCFGFDGDKWEGDTGSFIQYYGLDNVYADIADTILEMKNEEMNYPEDREAYTYLLELKDLLRDDPEHYKTICKLIDDYNI